MPDYLHLPYNEIVSTLEDILVKNSFSRKDSRSLAEIFATNSLEGVYSHGVNRFPRFMEYLSDGHIKPDKKAVLKHAAGSIEQWDGQSGPGPVNALIATERAMELARQYGMGCVALANTNHWMRGGTYGWIAAKAGFAYISWTNTIANLPAWGAKDARLGNNPLVIGVPNNGEAIVVDMALSQYSFGALEVKKQNNQMLPMPGGYDKDGNLTTDPTAIIESWRALPIGYWKGAGLSLLLDILGTILSGGLSVSDITASGAETNSSQIFIAFDVSKLHNFATIQATINGIIDDLHASVPEKEGSPVRYPGESVLKIRKENLAKGIPVLKEVWERIVEFR
jgi:3-dehydro-L-gulonate 2-dehydrogenase